MADGIQTEHEVGQRHGGGLRGALRDIPTWGWWAMGGAALILILWKMKGSGSSSASTPPAGLDAGTTALPATSGGSGDTSGGSADNTQAIIQGIAGLQQSETDTLSQMMQQQSDALAQAFDLSAAQQAAAFQGLSDVESGLGDTMAAVLSAVNALSQNPIVNNPGTSGDGNSGTGQPTGMPIGGGADDLNPGVSPSDPFPFRPVPLPTYDLPTPLPSAPSLPAYTYTPPSDPFPVPALADAHPIVPTFQNQMPQGQPTTSYAVSYPGLFTAAPAPSAHDPVVIKTEIPVSGAPRGVPQRGSGGDVGIH